MPSKISARSAHQRLVDHKARVQEVQQTLSAAVQKAREEHPTLNGIGSEYGGAGRAQEHNQRIVETREALVEKAREAARAELTRLIEQAAKDEQTLAEYAATNRAQPTTASGLLAQRHAWDRIRQLLESGVAMTTVIQQTTDPISLHAIREEGPAWLQAQAPMHWDPQSTRALQRSVDLRLADVSEPPVAEALRWEQEALVLHEETAPYVNAAWDLAHGVQSSSGLSSAIESHYRRRRVEKGYVEPTAAPSTGPIAANA
jgi:hypothetical protein